MVNISLQQELMILSVKDTHPCAGLGQEEGWLTLLHKPSVAGLLDCAGAMLDQRAGCRTGLRDELGLRLEYFSLLWDALCCTQCMETFLIYSLTLE